VSASSYIKTAVHCPACAQMIRGGVCSCNRIIKSDPHTPEEIERRAALARKSCREHRKIYRQGPNVERYDQRPSAAADRNAACREVDEEINARMERSNAAISD
jgi:hypothetical protein